MSEFIVPIMMIAALIFGIFSGYPVAFVLAGVGILFGLLSDIPFVYLNTVVSKMFSATLTNWLLMAVPLFVFMGLMLERSDIAKNLLLALERLFAGMRGGLAVAVTLVGIVMAASTGIVGASVVMLGLMATPVMMKSRYSPALAAGTVCSAGTLGILIPPSIMLVLLGDILQISVGDLFLAAALPGVMLGGLYLLYILVVSNVLKDVAPAYDADVEGDTDSNVWMDLIKNLVAPVLLIVGVLGSILAGIATPTEAAAIGAAGAMLLALALGKLTWEVLRDCVKETALTTAMIIAIALTAAVFTAVFTGVGGHDMIELGLNAVTTSPYATLGIIMLVIFVLGFFLEWIEISYVVLPILAPIVSGLDFGFDSSGTTVLWFAVLIAVNMQTSFLTPPFGYSLFYLRGIAPPEMTIGEIYKGIVPFVVLQLLGLGLCVLFPQIILYLPEALGR
ncbi:TRAP transporter large permease [Stappia indica]|uniref:TRAP transporter large permease n=1 Tax=Stappia indica TaxID=538381 RepID=UPI001CD3A4BA|nr:TRAP transporter large permease subunit [Stappia indica]MCA1300188.1 TRAP transporter large permease subunit [Stappia indica]